MKMIKSIRTSIFVYLGLIISFSAVLITSSTSYYLNRQDIRQHLDSVLAITGLSINAALNHDSINQLKKIQGSFDEIPELFQSIHNTHFSTKAYQKQYKIQIIDKQKNILVESTDAPDLLPALILKPGFQDIHQWRVFVTYNLSNHYYIVLSELNKTRSHVIQKIILENFYLLLIIIPLMSISIWTLINKSLQPIKQVIQQVRKRNPNHLKPLNIQNTPEEIEPLITEINQLLKRLKNGLTREQQFAGDAAHEIRTPLATIKTLAQTALHSENQDELKYSLNKIISNVDRGSHVIEQLMNMSKTLPEIQKKSHFKITNLVELIGQSLAHIVPQALEKNIDIEFETEKKSYLIFANPIAIDILIRNLVDNSIRYSPKDTHIYVKVYQVEKSVVLEVRDEGPGIPKALKDKVFERFYRIQDQTVFQGSGLGLAIVKQIANLHDAPISLEAPIRSSGVIFRIFFPLHQ
jgi:two-component system, OmpR family, sensor histidine kinase QseC